MAARRLVLNGLTAEVAGVGGVGADPGRGNTSPEFYHELELYRQLLALTETTPRRARTPDPPPPQHEHECLPRRCRTPAPRSRRADSAPPPSARHARYLGSFPAGGGEHEARVETVSRRLHLMKESEHAIPVIVVVALTGVKVCDPEDQSVRMCHALRRISYTTCEAPRALFAFVAREPRCEPTSQYCHAFETDSPEQAEELNALVGDAFRMAFASQLQPSAPLWSKELSGGSCPRAPDTLPGLTHHYPHRLDRSPSQCDIMGGSKLDGCDASEPSEASEASPSSSEDWNSPTELSCYRRLGERLERMERPPLMKRLALGLSGALLQPSDDDATPLVTDTPTTDTQHSSPTNVPLCLNGGYINEASEAEARRDARRDQRPDPDFRTCNNITNGRPGPGSGSGAGSSSSGESSCSRASGNNNNCNLRPLEPELRHAPWFQQGIPREIALEVLGAQTPGSFLVRASTTQAGCLALSLRVPRDFAPHGIAHYLILRTNKGYKIKGFTKEFSSLSALVTHHSVMPELLPVALRLPRRAPRYNDERENIDELRTHDL
nr:tensin-2-like isoform X2 [Danaus plexippus plexippus]